MTSHKISAPGFVSNHPWDRTFFLAYILLIWLVMIVGFGLDMANNAAAHKPPYPLIVHLHALVYVSWLVLFTVQIVLIRKGDYRTHKLTGLISLGLMPLMALLGPATALTMWRLHYNPSDPSIGFMATQFTNVIGCLVLLSAGLILRNDPSTHKRLMLMGTLAITEPGFARIWFDLLYKVLGDGVWQFYVEDYIGTLIAMLGVGLYDWVTRRRLHPAYMAAFIWVVANEVAASVLFYNATWIKFCRHLIGH